MEDSNNSVYNALSHSASFCVALENVLDTEKSVFVANVARLLANLYVDFSESHGEEDISFEEEDFFSASSSMNFVSEEFYNDIRHRIESILGEDDIYLEAFHEDMKYSDTPVSASISEGLADIFQDLYNFISEARDSDADGIRHAFRACKENFRNYWGQVACNLLRPLHYLIQNPN